MFKNTITMGKQFFWALMLLACAICLVSLDRLLADPQPADNRVLLLDVSGAIGPASSDFIIKGLKHAEESHKELLIIQLDTPGGLDASMRTVNKAILASPVPVAVYVSPAGARAASAGTYMLYASHVAVMAPGTNLGASTPVQMGGIPDSSPDQSAPEDKKADKPIDGKHAPDVDKDTATEPARGKSTMEKKVTNDAAAYLRGLAQLRGRNVEWAELTVREAKSLTAEEALQQNVIDIMAPDVNVLLEKIHGRMVKMATGEKILNTKGATIEHMEPDWRIRLLTVLTNPDIAYFLLLLGFYGLIYEFMSPGFVLPGVIGAICLLLGLYALQVLPINYAGLALIFLGIAFMVAEAFMPSFGIVGIGGLIAFAVGSVILLDEETYSISIPLIAGNALVSGAFFVWVLGRAVKLRKKPPVSGVDTMLGAVAQATEDFAERGQVRIDGELWNAVTDKPVITGQKLRIRQIEGLLLHVEPAEDYSDNKGVVS